MRERGKGAEGIVRHGDTSPGAMREKARFVMTIMQERLLALGGTWDRVTVIDVYAATIPTFHHEPKLHVNYAETVLRIKDGLPKMKDMPSEMGGSGDTLAE